MSHIYGTFVECYLDEQPKEIKNDMKKDKMSVYRITSDIFSNEDDFVVADSITSAIKCYVEKYAGQNMEESNIKSIERIAENCLISEK